MIRSAFKSTGIVLLAATAMAQQDASSRLHSTTQKPRELTYEMATGTLRPEKGPSAFFGPDVVYNNTCILTTLFFAGMSPTNVFLDNGQVPSSFNLPAGNGGIMLTGTASTAPGVAVFDGITCTGGSTLRLGAGFETASGVRVYAGRTLSAEANGASPDYMAPGLTIYFVYWFRDVAAGASPCGSGANFSVTLCLTLS